MPVSSDTRLYEVTADSVYTESRISGVYIRNRVSEYYNITVARLTGKGRNAASVHARQIAMWLCRILINLPYQQIGMLFNRDHSTVMTSCDRISMLMRTKKDFSDELDRVIRYVDPHHRVIDSVRHYVCSGTAMQDLNRIVSEVVEEAKSKGIASIDVTFKLLRVAPLELKRSSDESETDLSHI